MESKKTKDVRSSSNYDELLIHQRLLFADSLKDLRNVKDQLYSAAEHFEDSYNKNDHKQLLLESLKDYVSKSLIKTIDHLGSVTYKVNHFLDENVNEVSRIMLRALCIKQRLGTSRAYIDHGGVSQQSLMIQIPKHHKQYIIEGIKGELYATDGGFSEAVRTEKGKAQSTGLRKGHSGNASTEHPSGLIAFSFTKAAPSKRLEKRSRSVSPLRFPIKHTGSTTPSFSVKLSASFVRRSIGPNSSSSRQHPSEASRSYSLHPEREKRKDIEVYSKKTQNLFKALLSMHKSKNSNIQYR